MVRKIRIPSRYIRIERTAATIGTRAKDGTMTGRRVVRRGGDATYTRRLIRSVDFNKNKRIDPGEHGGIILGRTQKVEVKASKRAKGYMRQI